MVFPTHCSGLLWDAGDVNRFIYFFKFLIDTKCWIPFMPGCRGKQQGWKTSHYVYLSQHGRQPGIVLIIVCHLSPKSLSVKEVGL